MARRGIGGPPSSSRNYSRHVRRFKKRPEIYAVTDSLSELDSTADQKRRGPMSRCETNTPPADLSVTHQSDDADASPSGRVTMIHRPREALLDSRDLPGGQPSHTNIDKVT